MDLFGDTQSHEEIISDIIESINPELAKKYGIRKQAEQPAGTGEQTSAVENGGGNGTEGQGAVGPKLIKSWGTKKGGRKVELFIMPETFDREGNRHVKIGRRLDGGEILTTKTNGVFIPTDLIDYERPTEEMRMLRVLTMRKTPNIWWPRLSIFLMAEFLRRERLRVRRPPSG